MVPDNVYESVSVTFDNAVENGHIKVTDSTSSKHTDSKTGMQFVVTYAPGLKDKPEQKQDAENPFLNPSPELTVLEDVTGDGKYKLLLNRFPVVPKHSLLITSKFEAQNSALSPESLYTAFSLLCKMDQGSSKRHLLFYNSGPLSGASQEHKHFQYMELPENFSTLQDSLCAGKSHFLPNARQEPLQSEKVSFAHFTLPLPDDKDKIDEELLAMCYFSLVQRVLTFFKDWENNRPELMGKFSYNLLMTQNWICLVPRSKAASVELGLGFNSTAYAGLILVKDEDTKNKVEQNIKALDEALLECGFNSTAGEKTTEYDY